MRISFISVLSIVFLICGLLILVSLSQAQEDHIVVLVLDNTIHPITARYIQRGISRAQQDEAELVVIELNTPGGLVTSMNQIVEKILPSKVPVVVYVFPQGARAASAGVFITMAAHVAAMAPGTNIGAAHPVGAQGGDIEGDIGEKVLNDTVAKIKSIAEVRGRNAEWAEKAVRESVSLTEREAVDQNVVDLVAKDLDELLSEIDGRRVETSSGEITINTEGVPVRVREMNFIDRFLAIVVDPNISYIFLLLGIYGLIFEFTNPGIGGAGVAGGIAILLAFISFGSLPTNIGGILLIILGAALLLFEVLTPTHGVLTVGGVIGLLLGSFLLFPPWRPPSLPGAPDLGISPITILIMTGLTVAFFTFVISSGLQAQRKEVASGSELLLGASGMVVSDLKPDGSVKVGGEDWSAYAEEGEIGKEEEVEVVAVEGIRLKVKRKSK